MKKLIFLLIIVFGVTYSFAGFVPIKVAEKVAKAYYYQGFNSIAEKSWDGINLTIAEEPVENLQYYIFNVNTNEGFVVVSAESAVKPILAYSFEGLWNGDNMSPGQKWFMDYYTAAISSVQSSKAEAPTEIAQEWAELLDFNPTKNFKQKSTVGPLLYVKWNQDWPYNAYCPEDAGGSNGHVYVGCVATAMVQAMKYYNYPPSGEGSKTHISWLNGGYGNIIVNFAQQTYDWYSMPLSVSGDVNDAVAKINFHAGVAVSMTWGPDGSGSQTSRIETALRNYFKYNSDVDFVEKSDYSETAWKNLLKNQIDQGRPMVYSGSPSSGAGHAWNCDGYQDDDKFHMNWGWGGAGNGYYTLDNLNSSATPGGDENNFIYGQDAIIDIYPGENYPANCSGDLHLTSVEGAFGDGSGNTTYDNNKNCTYTIEPECGQVVQVKFVSFDLGAGDVVNLYDGNGTDNELLDTYDSSNPPALNTNITGAKGAVTIQFVSDGSGVGQGWDVTYNTRNCRTNMMYIDAQGVVNDGSGPCDYANSTVCTYFIEPNDAEWININFTEFDLAGNIDFVKVFKGQINGEVVGEFNQNNAPSSPMMVEDGVVAIQFFADANNNGTGWTLEYTSSVTSIEENKILSGIQLYPNPTDGNSKIGFYLDNTEDVNITISDMTGKVIANSSQNLAKGHHSIEISSILKVDLTAGIYFVTLSTSNSDKATKKLVVME
jgi:hypothetical protein